MKYIPKDSALAVAKTTIRSALLMHGNAPIVAQRHISSPLGFHDLMRDCLQIGMEINPLLMAYAEHYEEPYNEMRVRMWQMAMRARTDHDRAMAAFLGLRLALYGPARETTNCIRRVMQGCLLTYRSVVITTACSPNLAHVVMAGRGLPQPDSVRKALRAAEESAEPQILFEPPRTITPDEASSAGQR